MTKLKLLITLVPGDYYFFGGEETFDNAAGKTRNYLVRSNLLPQQTALVGLLRHILYLNEFNIGPESFRPDASDTDFGALKKVHPLFLQYGDGPERRFLLPSSKLWLKNEQEIMVDFNGAAGTGFAGQEFSASPNLTFHNAGKKEQYTYKEQFGAFWTFLDDGTKLPEKLHWKNDNPKSGEDNGGIFISSTHIGIDKMNRMKARTSAEKLSNPDDEAFYKQEFYSLRENFRFALVAEFETDSDPADFEQCFNTTMPFGGEARTFSIRAEKWEDFQDKFQPEKAFGSQEDRIVLMSDAWVESPDRLLEHCRFAVTKAKPFRNIQIRKDQYETPNAFSNLHHFKKKLMYLLERGSVLFPKEPDSDTSSAAIVNILKAPINFQNIGYNKFHSHKHPFSI